MQTQANTSRPEKNWYILTNASRKAIRTSAKLPAQGLNVQCHLRVAACNSGSYQRNSCQEAPNKNTVSAAHFSQCSDPMRYIVIIVTTLLLQRRVRMKASLCGRWLSFFLDKPLNTICRICANRWLQMMELGGPNSSHSKCTPLPCEMRNTFGTIPTLLTAFWLR